LGLFKQSLSPLSQKVTNVTHLVGSRANRSW
jgi:hypothetical protein